MSYTIEKSPSKFKKYVAIFPDGKRVHFGDKRYKQYRDSTPLKLYKELDHLDDARRQRFRARFKTPGPQHTAKWFSWHYLW